MDCKTVKTSLVSCANILKEEGLISYEKQKELEERISKRDRAAYEEVEKTIEKLALRAC
jgi:hypothetical protein